MQVDWPIRTESTESITGWVSITGAIEFLVQRHEKTQIHSETMSLTLGYYDNFLQIEHKKLLIFTLKLPTAALTTKVLVYKKT